MNRDQAATELPSDSKNEPSVLQSQSSIESKPKGSLMQVIALNKAKLLTDKKKKSAAPFSSLKTQTHTNI
jgi:hypothetical protein